MDKEGIRIPISRFLKERESQDELERTALRETLGKDVVVAGADVMTSITTDIGEATGSIIIKHFELTEKLISDSYVIFPPRSESFSQETVARAEFYGLTQVEVPGLTGVPKLVSLLQRGEIDESIFLFLWNYLAPHVPPPIRPTLDGPTNSDWSFLGIAAGLSQEGKLVEGNEAPYRLRFHKSYYMLVETFPDPTPSKIFYNGDRITDIPPHQDSLLLKLLNIGRARVTRSDLNAAITEHGPSVLEHLQLNPERYRLHPIRYEDFLRLGIQYDWGKGCFETFLDGWWQNTKGSPLPMVAGRSYQNPIYQTRGIYGYNEGLTAHYNLNAEQEEYTHKNNGIMVRLAITSREISE